MDISVAKTRLSEVVQTCAITDTDYDFLATHIPLQKLKMLSGNPENPQVSMVSEGEAFNRLFGSDGLNNHQLVVVEGGAGSGKSHFIRWIYSRLRADEVTCANNVILLIRRKENSLKGTISQLLQIEEVKSMAEREIYERLVSAGRNIGKEKFKGEILHQFANEVWHDEDENCPLKNVQRKRLHALLMNPIFSELLQKRGRPIDRVYRKLNGGDDSSEFIDFFFKKEDFTLDTEFCETLEQNGADRNASSMARKLIPDEDATEDMATKVASYLNSLVDRVVQEKIGINAGDFNCIFESIRKELRKQGKDLILLIEDITSFTGIDQALLNALIIEHRGMNESSEMCRLISVVGTTSEYYKGFRDNYRQRVTMELVIGNDAIGTKRDDIYLFFAKYLNAISLPSDVIQDWFKDGALFESLPIHIPAEIFSSDFLDYEGKRFSLYPFTKRSIDRFCEHYLSSNKSPRSILTSVIKPAVQEVIDAPETYMTFCKNGDFTSILDNTANQRIRNYIDRKDMGGSQKSLLQLRVLAFVALYGVGTAEPTPQRVYGIDRQLYKHFGMSAFSDEVIATTTSEIQAEEASEKNSADEETAQPNKSVKKYNDFFANRERWRKGDKFIDVKENVLTPANKFVCGVINWEQNGVPLWISDAMDHTFGRGHELISIVDPDHGHQGLITLQREDNGDWAFIDAMAQFKIHGNGSWKFKDGVEQMYIALSWVEKNKKRIIEAVLESCGMTISELGQCIVSTKMLSQILLSNKKIKNGNLTDRLFVEPLPDLVDENTHGKAWNDLSDKIERELSNLGAGKFDCEAWGFYTLTVANKTAASTNNRFFRYESLVSDFKKAKEKGFVLELENVNSALQPIKELVKTYAFLKDKLPKVLEAEKAHCEEMALSIRKGMELEEGFPLEEEDIEDLKRGEEFFKQKIRSSGVTIPVRSVQLKLDTCAVVKTFEEIEEMPLPTLNQFLCMSGDFLAPIEPLYNWLKSIGEDLKVATKFADTVEKNFAKKGTVISERDIRFGKTRDDFVKTLRQLEEFKDAE